MPLFLLTRSAFIQSQNVFTTTSNSRRFRLHFSTRRESIEHVNGPWLCTGERSWIWILCSAVRTISRRVLWPVSFHMKARMKLMHVMSWSVKSWSYQKGEWNCFKTVLACNILYESHLILPHLTHSIQLVSSLETLRPEWVRKG